VFVAVALAVVGAFCDRCVEDGAIGATNPDAEASIARRALAFFSRIRCWVSKAISREPSEARPLDVCRCGHVRAFHDDTGGCMCRARGCTCDRFFTAKPADEARA
jgi:hypothetical protein